MIYPMVPFPVTSSDPYPKFQGHGFIVDALDVLCAKLTRDLFAIAKFLLYIGSQVASDCRSAAAAVWEDHMQCTPISLASAPPPFTHLPACRQQCADLVRLARLVKRSIISIRSHKSSAGFEPAICTAKCITK